MLRDGSRDVVERKDFVGDAGVGNGAGHAPDGGGGLILSDQMCAEACEFGGSAEELVAREDEFADQVHELVQKADIYTDGGVGEGGGFRGIEVGDGSGSATTSGLGGITGPNETTFGL